MAEKISVQIALEGGAEVERQLADISKAGQQAFADISKSAEQVGGFKNLDPGVVTAKLKEFGVTGVEEINKIQKALSTAVRFEKLVTGVQAAEQALVAMGRAAGIAAAAVAAAFVAMAKPTIAFANAINKASDQAVKLGLSLEQFKSLQKDFEKLGVSGGAAAQGFAKFQQELQRAAQADPGSNLALFGQNADVAKQQLDQFLQRLQQMPDSLQRTQLAISQLGEAAGIQFIQGLRRAEGSMSESEAKAYDLGQAVQRLKSAWDDFGSLVFAPGLTVAINAITTAVQALTTAFGGVGIDAAGIETALKQLFDNLLNSLNNMLPSFLAAGQAIANAILEGFKNALTPPPIEEWGQAILNDLNKFINSIIANWEILKQKLGAPLPVPSGAAGGGTGTGGGLARGGLIGGRGSGTSDSNLAWLSRGEFVIRSAAVRQFGAGFFAALNAGLMPGFALGGLVPRPAMAFAGGGPVGGGNHVTIQFPGLPPVGGLRASSAVVEQLQRSAALAQVRSGGRKPSRYS